jgi:Spy/CpxP family protein refolding chaperone
MNNEVLTQKGSLPPPTPPRKKWRLILLCISFLVCGIFIGAVLTQTILFHHKPWHGNSEDRANEIVSHMRKNLNLTDDQSKQVYAIIKERFTALDDTLRNNFDVMDSKIRAVLNSEQIVKFDKEMVERRKKSFDNPKENK